MHKPGSREEALQVEKWARKNVRSAIDPVCKAQNHAIKNIDPAEEEHF